MSQTSYTMNIAAALAGMLAEPLNPRNKVESKTNAATLPAGVFVTRDAADDAVKVPVDAAGVTATGVGFTILDVAKEPVSDGSTTDWKAGVNLPVCTHGKLWVLTETACAYGGDVYARYTASGGNTQLGKVRNDDDTTKAGIAPGWKFRSTLGAAGLALIER